MKAIDKLLDRFERNYRELVQDEASDNNPITPPTDYKLLRYLANLRKPKAKRKE